MARPFTPSPLYPAALAHRDALAAGLEVASARLRSVPGVGTGRMGLTPDHVKATATYQNAKRSYDHWFALVRDFNGTFVRTFKRELAADRAAARAVKMASL